MYHELFEGQDQLPFHIFLIDAESEHTHAHAELEICFLLSGSAQFHVYKNIFPLYEHDFIVVHPLTLHKIERCSDNCHILFLQIDLFSFQKYVTQLSQTVFEFSNIMNNRNHTLYQTIYQCLHNILNTALKGSATWRLDALQEVINILKALLTHYEAIPDSINTSLSLHDERSQKRMLLILEYLENHWQDSITLPLLAEKLEMSSSYFSRFFKKNMGIGFLNYLTKLRLKRSLNLLLDTDTSIIDIALECGFNDYKTYSRLFKKEYGDNPQVYRKSHTPELLKVSRNTSLNPTKVFEPLLPVPLESTSSKKLRVPLEIDLNKKALHKKSIYWNHTINVGTAIRILRHKIQDHILYASKHIQLQYIRFSDLFSESLQVYWEDPKGRAHFNWEYLDDIFDFLNENHLYPFIVLDTMPDALSTYTRQTNLTQRELIPAGQTCVPKSMEKFQTLIREFVNHYIQRYNDTHILEHCRVQLWAFPEAPGNLWNGTEEQFFELVKQTYFTLREALPEMCLCSPSTMGWKDFAMLKRFLSFCKKEHIYFDIFCLNFYGFSSSLNKDYSEIFKPYEAVFPYLDGDEYLNRLADDMSILLSQGNFTQPIVVTEWGINPYTKDLSRDTAFMSTWIIQQLVHLSPNIKEICYCLLTDHFFQSSSLSSCDFIGGQGLLTHGGIPKPSFSTFEMLGVLGEDILAFGKDYLLTKTGKSWRLLIYNYSYYSEAYLNGKQELLFEEDRYNIYQNSLSKTFEMQISLTPGRYRLETTQINQENCAPYDEWIKMGKPNHTSAFYHKYLINKCYPSLQVETINTSDKLQLQRTVPVHGITVIKIDRI